MGSEPPAEEWEQILGADLLPHLEPAGRRVAARQPLDVTVLPAGAHEPLADSIGRHRLEDLLILPGRARPYGRLRRRCLYTPLRVLGVGDRAVALWVQALPAPGLRAVVPFGEIAAITVQAERTSRQLAVISADGRLPVRYDAAGDIAVDALIRRLRSRTAGDPAPVPAGYPVIRSRRRPAFDPDVLRLDPDDQIAAAGRYGRAGRRMCLLAATLRELMIMRSFRTARLPGRATETIYIPRRAIEEISVEPDSLMLRSAGLGLRIMLASRKTAAAASAWLDQVLSDHHHSGAGS
jgi:hypothetical protein